MDSMD
jgi:hypothetical protein